MGNTTNTRVALHSVKNALCQAMDAMNEMNDKSGGIIDVNGCKRIASDLIDHLTEAYNSYAISNVQNRQVNVF